MLAFWALEKDELGAYTEECELGADLVLQYQNEMIALSRSVLAYFEALASRKP